MSQSQGYYSLEKKSATYLMGTLKQNALKLRLLETVATK